MRTVVMFRGTVQRSLEIGYLMELLDEVLGSIQNIHGFIATCKTPLIKIWSIKQNYWELNMHMYIHVRLLSFQLCPTFCDPMDCSLPGSSVHGVFWARILQSVDIPFYRRSSPPRDRTQVACIGRWVLNHLSHQCVCVCMCVCVCVCVYEREREREIEHFDWPYSILRTNAKHFFFFQLSLK